MNDNELGAFLRARRHALRPADVGLIPGGRRRTPGLRREEVAMLANVSVDYYERLERSRGNIPSESLLASLARALRLSVDERDYLYHLAGHPTPAARAATGYVEPSMMYLLDALDTVPAHVIDHLTTVLAQNSLSTALIGPWTKQKGRAANVTWRWFTDPDSRALNVPEEHEQIGRGYVADLRAAAARHPDPTADRLVADLRAASEEFAAYWDEMVVAPLRSNRKSLIHSHAGHLDVQCDVVLAATTGQRLIIFRPQPGTRTAEALDFLRVLGHQTFESRTGKPPR